MSFISEEDAIKLAEFYTNCDCLSDKTKDFMINDLSRDRDDPIEDPQKETEDTNSNEED